MNPFNEAAIDKKTDLRVKTRLGPFMNSTDDKSEIIGDFYEDLSDMSNLEGAKFIKALADECKKSAGYGNRIVYIPVNYWAFDNLQSPVGYLTTFIREKPDRFLYRAFWRFRPDSNW